MYEVHDYIKSYLGETNEAHEFAKSFLDRRQKIKSTNDTPPTSQVQYIARHQPKQQKKFSLSVLPVIEGLFRGVRFFFQCLNSNDTIEL